VVAGDAIAVRVADLDHHEIMAFEDEAVARDGH